LGEKGLTDYFSSLPESINQFEVARLIKGLAQGRSNGARLFALMMLSFSAKNLKWS
jgi:hypothetical protein